MQNQMDQRREEAVRRFQELSKEHTDTETLLKNARKQLEQSRQLFNKTESDLLALQSSGQIIGEVLKQIDGERCMFKCPCFGVLDFFVFFYGLIIRLLIFIRIVVIIKVSNGPRYVVGVRRHVNKSKLVMSARVALDMTTFTIMRILPREVDPMVFTMLSENPGKVSYSDIGGLSEQIRQLREVIELPLINPELFVRVGIKPPKGVLLFGPPGTGKTLIARAMACNIDSSFLKVVSSAIVDKYIGESARVIREMFGLLLVFLNVSYSLVFSLRKRAPAVHYIHG